MLAVPHSMSPTAGPPAFVVWLVLFAILAERRAPPCGCGAGLARGRRAVGCGRKHEDGDL